MLKMQRNDFNFLQHGSSTDESLLLILGVIWNLIRFLLVLNLVVNCCESQICGHSSLDRHAQMTCSQFAIPANRHLSEQNGKIVTCIGPECALVNVSVNVTLAVLPSKRPPNKYGLLNIKTLTTA